MDDAIIVLGLWGVFFLSVFVFVWSGIAMRKVIREMEDDERARQADQWR